MILQLAARVNDPMIRLLLVKLLNNANLVIRKFTREREGPGAQAANGRRGESFCIKRNGKHGDPRYHVLSWKKKARWTKSIITAWLLYQLSAVQQHNIKLPRRNYQTAQYHIPPNPNNYRILPRLWQDQGNIIDIKKNGSDEHTHIPLLIRETTPKLIKQGFIRKVMRIEESSITNLISSMMKIQWTRQPWRRRHFSLTSPPCFVIWGKHCRRWEKGRMVVNIRH